MSSIGTGTGAGLGGGTRESGFRRSGSGFTVLAALVLILAVGLWLRTRHIGETNLSFDESCSAKISTFPWAEMLDAISRDAHPPVYYVVLKGWRFVVGDNPVILRGLSVLLGMATIVASSWLVRVVLCDDPDTVNTQSRPDMNAASLLAAALVATSGLQVELTYEARSYALGVFLSMISAGFLLRAVRPTGAILDWTAFTLAAALLSMTHYYGLFTVAAELLFAGALLLSALVREGWTPRTRRFLAGIGLAVWSMQLVWMTWLPVFEFQRERANRQLWMPPLDWDGFASAAWTALAGDHDVVELSFRDGMLAVVLWGGSALALLALPCRGARLIGLCMGTPLLACVAYALAVRNILGARYLVFAHASLLVGWALLFAQLRSRAGRIAYAGIVLAWSGACSCHVLEVRARKADSPGILEATRYLDEHRRPGEPVIVASPFVHPIVQRHSAVPERILARYYGDYRLDLLAGPPLRESECTASAALGSNPSPRIWVIDLELTRGAGWIVRPPIEFELVAQERFQVRRPRKRAEIVIREYVRRERVSSSHH